MPASGGFRRGNPGLRLLQHLRQLCRSQGTARISQTTRDFHHYLLSELIPSQALCRHPGKGTPGRFGAGSSSRRRLGCRPGKHRARGTEGTLRERAALPPRPGRPRGPAPRAAARLRRRGPPRPRLPGRTATATAPEGAGEGKGGEGRRTEPERGRSGAGAADPGLTSARSGRAAAPPPDVIAARRGRPRGGDTARGDWRRGRGRGRRAGRAGALYRPLAGPRGARARDPP